MKVAEPAEQLLAVTAAAAAFAAVAPATDSSTCPGSSCVALLLLRLSDAIHFSFICFILIYNILIWKIIYMSLWKEFNLAAMCNMYAYMHVCVCIGNIEIKMREWKA